jgi:hypothetical protein
VWQIEARPDLPPANVLREESAQVFVVERAFSEANLAWLPPAAYRLKTLQALVAAVEESIVDWELHVREMARCLECQTSLTREGRF